MKECLLCHNERESVSHVLWEFPAYSSFRSLGFSISSRLIASFLWVVSGGRINLVLCSALLKVLLWMFGS